MHSTLLGHDNLIADGLFALALDTIAEGAIITDAERRIIYANAAFETITGYAAAEIIGRSCSFLQGPGTSDLDLSHMRQALDAGEPYTARLLNYRRDRSTFWNDLSITPMRDAYGTVTHFVSVQRDVTYEVGLEATLRYTQEFDGLTGLPNRETTRSFLASALTRARLDGTAVALAVGTITGFRELNHNYGYAAGDVMLEELAFRVRGVVRSQDLFGRLAADEFALVLTGLPHDYDAARDGANLAVQRVAQVLRQPIDITAGHDWIAALDFGLSIAPFDGREAESLLLAAETKGTSAPTSWPDEAAAIADMFRVPLHR